MEKTEQKSNLIVGLLSGLTILLFAFGMYTWHKNGLLRKQDDLRKQRADSLLSENLHLKGNIHRVNDQLHAAVTESSLGKEQLTELNTRVSRRNELVGSLRRAHFMAVDTLQQLHQNLSQLSTVRDSLENQMAAIIDKIDWLNDSNALLLGQNEDLQRTIDNLTTDLVTKVSRSAITADGFRVEAKKPNGKETAKANKVYSLAVSFSVPAELRRDTVQEVFLSLMNAQKQTPLPALRTTTITLPTVNEVVPIHAVQRINFNLNPQRITFQMTPNEPIEPGLYRASIYTKDDYLGSVEFQFRTSFLFF